MPAIEKRELLEDVLAILDRTPGVENVGCYVPYPVLVRQNADESIGTIKVDLVSGNPAAAVDAPVNANAPVRLLSARSSSNAGQEDPLS